MAASDHGAVRRKYAVQALARHGSEHKPPHGCKVIPGDALDKNSYVLQIPPAETFVQLIGVTHPNPAKKDEFRVVDLGSARAAIDAAREPASVISCTSAWRSPLP